MNTQYKDKADVKRRYKKIQIEDELIVHLTKEFFLVGTYNKIKSKKFGLCKMVKRHDSKNTYEEELPTKLNISPVFNISDFKKYYERGDGDEVVEAQWSIPVASSAMKEIEEIQYSCVEISTRNKNYEEYLAKWKGRPVEDSL